MAAMSDQELQTRDEKSEMAYAVWSTEGQGDTAKTSAITGIPRSTIQRYMREDGWERRYELEQMGDTQDAVFRAARMVQGAMPEIAARMIGIACGTKPLVNTEGRVVTNPETGRPVMVPIAENKDSINAARWLMQYGFMSAVDLLRDGNAATSYDSPWGTGSAPSINSPTSYAEKSRDILNANYAAANTRKLGRGR